jgi:hypothetical protein
MDVTYNVEISYGLGFPVANHHAPSGRAILSGPVEEFHRTGGYIGCPSSGTGEYETANTRLTAAEQDCGFASEQNGTRSPFCGE